MMNTSWFIYFIELFADFCLFLLYIIDSKLFNKSNSFL